eukprot:7550331-Lingulodinium_polyedra.AAC.1
MARLSQICLFLGKIVLGTDSPQCVRSESVRSESVRSESVRSESVRSDPDMRHIWVRSESDMRQI